LHSNKYYQLILSGSKNRFRSQIQSKITTYLVQSDLLGKNEEDFYSNLTIQPEFNIRTQPVFKAPAACLSQTIRFRPQITASRAYAQA
jgi:hypothetical protein